MGHYSVMTISVQYDDYLFTTDWLIDHQDESNGVHMCSSKVRGQLPPAKEKENIDVMDNYKADSERNVVN